jgi:ProP effector
MLKTKASGVGVAEGLGKASSGIDGLPTKIASTSKAAARHGQTVAAALAPLAEKWPACFQIFEQRRRPIKIGIHLDILAALGGAVTSAEVKFALRLYAGNLGYLLACRDGVERVDLNGEPAGTVTAAEAAYAAKIVARRRRRAAAKIAAKPVTTARPRLGLVDLKRAALVRKAAAP